MNEEYTIYHFSLSLPKGTSQGNIPDLLRHLGTAIEDKQKEKYLIVQDIVFHEEIDDEGESWPSFTVYYHS